MLKFLNRSRSNIAQIIICVLLLPLFCAVLKQVDSDVATDFVAELVKSVPILELWFDLLLQFDGLNGLEELILKLEESAGAYLYISIWQVYIVALIFEILSIFADKIGWRGLKILPAVVSVFFAVVMQRLTDENILALVVELIALFLLYIVIVFFVSKTEAIKTIIISFIRMYFDTYVALFSTMYLATLGLICDGRISKTSELIVCLSLSFGGLLISAGLSYLVSPRKNK